MMPIMETAIVQAGVKGQVFQVIDWQCREEDLVQLDLEGRENGKGQLRQTKMRLLFNLTNVDSREQLARIFDDQRIQAPSLIGRLNLLKGAWIEVRSIQGILQE